MYGQVSLEQSPYGQNVMIINSNYSVFQKEDGKSWIITLAGIFYLKPAAR
jgi:hypothetical protein